MVGVPESVSLVALGAGSNLARAVISVQDLPGAVDLGVGRNHACVIVSASPTDTRIECWGLNTDGQLGNGTNTNSSVATEVLTPDWRQHIRFHSLAHLSWGAQRSAWGPWSIHADPALSAGLQGVSRGS